MKRFKLIYIAVGLACTVIVQGCEKELTQPSLGALSEQQLNNKKGVESLLTGAYAGLDGARASLTGLGGGGTHASSPTNWVAGSVGGGEAHYGLQGFQIAATRWSVDPSLAFANDAWNAYYEGITRANVVIRLAQSITDATESEKTSYIAQARFIRGHFYFYLKKLFNNVV